MMALVLVACAAAKAPPPVVLRFGDASLRVRVADEPSERSRGLMGVTDLGPDEGMLFVYPEPSARYFWMKDTPTALSIVFCDAEGVVLTMADMAPLDATLTPSTHPVLYAIEAHQGWFVDHGVRVGDRVAGLPPRAPK